MSQNIINRLRTLKKGEEFIYFKGHLVETRKKNGDGENPVADEAFRLAQLGKVCLVQKRCAEGFEYIAKGV